MEEGSPRDGIGALVNDRALLAGEFLNFPCGGDLFGRGDAILQRDLALANGDQRIVVVSLDLFHRAPGGVGGLAGDDADLFEGSARRAGAREVDVVDVAAGAVVDESDEVCGRSRAAHAMRHDAREFSEIIGRRHAHDLAVLFGDLGNAADVVQSEVGDESKRFTSLGAGVDDADLRIGRAGRADNLVARRIHPDLVEAAQRILVHRAGSQMPAAVENLGGFLVGAETDVGGFERFDGLSQRRHDAVEALFLIGDPTWGSVAALGRGVGVGGADEHLLGLPASAFGDDVFGYV